ncbi:MAG: hypothetical protein AABW92_02970 [Nanoarchaeota archaeon]
MQFNKPELNILKKLSSPNKIQIFLDNLPYNTDDIVRSPRYVLKERKAHCLDGAMFAAACLKLLGYKPLLVDMISVNDDDHVLAVFKKKNWGAIGKSNFTTLTYREPVYKTLRELIMSYFDVYFNSIGEKTLRGYSQPFNLDKYKDWMTTSKNLDYIGDAIDKTRHFPVIDKRAEKNLSLTNKKLLKAGLLGSDPKGLYKPEKYLKI